MANPTPFSAHLNTNYIPSEDEIPILRRIVAERNVEVDALSLQIAEMEQAVLVAKEQRKACTRDMEAHRELLTPIRRVPFEVLAAIFQACVPDIASLSAICSGISSRRHPSIVLSNVCHAWRTTALGSPTLWSELLIAVPTHTNPNHKAGEEWLQQMRQVRKAVEVWSSRSGKSLLTIRVASSATSIGTGQSGDTTREVLDSLMGAIKQTSSRWRGIVFSLVLGSLWEPGMVELLQVLPAALPQLKRVDLDIHSQAHEIGGRLHLTLQQMLASPSLLSAPSIHSLKLHGVWRDTSSPAITKHWPPLINLDIDCFHPTNSEATAVQSASQLIQLLNSIPTLTNVIFFIQGRSSAGDLLQPSTAATGLPQAPSLKSLTLKGAEVPKGFSRSIDLPALQDLHLQFTSLIPEGVESGIVECILRLGTQLKSLTFSPDAVNRHALVKILEYLPVLETLSLNPQGSGSHFRCSADRPGVDCYAITELNEAMYNHPGVDQDSVVNGHGPKDTLRCPRLRQLKLQTTRDRYEDDAVEQALVEFIARRRGRAWAGDEFQLQVVSISFRRERGPNTPNVLQELNEWDVDLCGFDLRLAYL